MIRGPVEAAVSGADVTMLRPDASGAGVPATRVNIFLYQVTPNPEWRNADLPNRRQDGTLVQRPVAALDLHYLLSFFGEEAQLEPQRLLATTVRALHTQPVLTGETIRQAIAAGPGTFLNGSNLADQPEPIRFYPAVLNLEDLSKLWSVFFQTPYSLSVAYTCSVVLIESDLSPQRALPVRAANIRAVSFNRPMIEDIVDADDPATGVTSASTIAIRGRQLGGDGVMIRIAGVESTPTSVGPSQVTLDLSTLPADALRSGVQGVQLIYPVVMSPTRTIAAAVESNVAPFVLRPRITGVVVDDVTGAGDELRSATVTLTVDPEVGLRQRGVMMLNQLDPAPGVPARAYTFALPSLDTPGAPESSSTIDIPVSGVAAGDYLIRVQIDGAESLLELGGDDNYATPAGTMP